ncbi:MAG: hypothetical protein WCO86_10765, partial [Planctomycetota bacterium]
RDGDVVSDMRSGLELGVKDGGLVPISAVPFQTPVPESRFIRWIVVFGTSLVLLLVLAVSFARQRRSAKQ